MNKSDKLHFCNRGLISAALLILVSSIHLEATGSRGASWVWLHTGVGVLFFADIVWHLQLHFEWKSWTGRLRKQKSPVTRWLAVFCLLTLASALAALFHWIGTHAHAAIGGVHGKIGFLFLALAVGHTIKRIKFFKRKKDKHKRAV